jgi:Na+/H+ antiporter NhaD/arsenite permease-like protein
VAPTPLVLHLARRLRIDPLPHLIGLATAANIGSTATITGNPQNMIIGSLSGIPYLRFAERLAPIALIGLVLDYVVVFIVYRRALAAKERRPATAPEEEATPRHPRQRRLLIKSLLVTLGVIGLFFTGASIALVALSGAAILLLERLRPEKIYRQLDWRLLVMFVGLFVVVHAFEVHVVRGWGLDGWGPLQRHPVWMLSLVAAGLSNLVSNVPAVLLFQPVIPTLPDAVQESAWLALAMSSTLAGNLTVLGSVANLIVVEGARREGMTVGFWEYCRAGVPITILTLIVGIAWLTVLP